jgi:DNA-binding transcriptional LysR family regulator
MLIPDLNLLRVFDVLLEERSVTRAGARLGLSQSAVSHALNRLRHALNDELFVRGPSGMLPTPRAAEIGMRIHGAMGQLQAALAPAEFHPQTSTRKFAIAAGGYAAAVLAPPLAARLAELAPQAELVVSGYSPDVIDMLDTRQVDFAVAGVVSAPERFGLETLIVEELAWVVSGDSPLARLNDVDLEALAATPHIVVGRQPFIGAEDRLARRGVVARASWEDAGAFEAALADAGLTRRVGVTVPDTYSALAVAYRSHMATLVPRRMALASATKKQLRVIDPPYPSPPVDIGLMYLKDRLAEPPVAWLHGLIREVADAL